MRVRQPYRGRQRGQRGGGADPGLPGRLQLAVPMRRPVAVGGQDAVGHRLGRMGRAGRVGGDQYGPARAGDSAQFVERRTRIGDVGQHHRGDRDVHRAVAQRQPADVGAHRRRRAHPQHVGRDVAADRTRAAAAQRPRGRAGAGARVQRQRAAKVAGEHRDRGLGEQPV